MYEIAFGMGFMMGYEEIEKVYHKKGVILDTRPVHLAIARNEAMREAQRKKPRLPVHAIMTASHPLVRFIGSDDKDQSSELFAVWLDKLTEWATQGTPYLFLHTADIGEVYSLLHRLWPLLQQRFPALTPPPAFAEQASLF